MSLKKQCAHRQPLSTVQTAAPLFTPHALSFCPAVVPFWGFCPAAVQPAVDSAAATAVQSSQRSTVEAGVAELPSPLQSLSAAAEVDASEVTSEPCFPLFELSKIAPAAPLGTAAPTATADSSLVSAQSNGVQANSVPLPDAQTRQHSPAAVPASSADQQMSTLSVAHDTDSAAAFAVTETGSERSCRTRQQTGNSASQPSSDVGSAVAPTQGGMPSAAAGRKAGVGRVRKDRPAAPLAHGGKTKMVTRSQTAAQQHIERMQTRSRSRQSAK